MVDTSTMYLAVQHAHKKQSVEDAIAVGMKLYEFRYGCAPTTLVISPETVYTTDSPELTVVQDSIVPKGVYYFGSENE